MSKIAFAQSAQEVSKNLALANETLVSMFHSYFDRGYNAGGSDPLIDADLTSIGVKAADIAAFITLAENFTKFLDGQTIFVSDYDSTINKLRTDI